MHDTSSPGTSGDSNEEIRSMPGSCEILAVRSCTSAGARAALLRRRHCGEIVSVGRGVYVDATVWGHRDRHGKYLLRVHAAARMLDQNTVFSHESAAALWRLPWVGTWPSRVHTAGATAAGGRSNSSVFRHTTGNIDDPEIIDGLYVTPLARTIVDVARTVEFGTAVTVADAALRRIAHPLNSSPETFVNGKQGAGAVPTHSTEAPSTLTPTTLTPTTLTPTAQAAITLLTRAALWEELALVPLRQGSARARAVIEFADGRADRPGESMSRVNMFRAQLPAPELQVSLRGQSGRMWVVDFWWPGCNLIGEFDDQWKYSDPDFLRGRTPHQVLLDEKSREDHLRAAGHYLSRWDWAIAMSPSRLKSHLLTAGLQ